MPVSFTLAEIADLAGATLLGDGSRVITGVAGVEDAGPDDLAFIDNPRYLPHLLTTGAGGVLVGRSVGRDTPGGAAPRNLLQHDAPRLAFAALLKRFNTYRPPFEAGVSPAAFVHPAAVVSAGASVAPHVYVGPEARVGPRTVLYPGTYVGTGVTIGADCLVYANVSIYHGCRLGDRVIVHSGAVLGSDGYGFESTARGHVKLPQLGNVVIGDDVEIGACVCVDRAALGSTVIGRGTKIDNLVQIGHSVHVGEDSLLVSQCGIAGSTRIGKRARVAGQAGIIGHLTIGDDVVLAAQSSAVRDVPAGTVIGGINQDIEDWRRSQAVYTHLPELREKVRRLEKEIAALKGKVAPP